jgi:hypothetical protein
MKALHVFRLDSSVFRMKGQLLIVILALNSANRYHIPIIIYCSAVLVRSLECRMECRMECRAESELANDWAKTGRRTGMH